jgi:Yip1 domain
MNLVERAKAILLQPKSEWKVIEGESGDPGFLFPNYVMILAAIPPVCTFIGTTLIGIGPFRVGIGSGIWHAIVSYVLALAGVYVMAYVIDFLAGTFGGQRSLASALKVSAYSPTAAWLAGVFGLVPMLSILSLLGLYSIYLLHIGIAGLMKPPANKAVLYTVVVIVVMIVVWLVIGGIVFALFGMGAMM